VAEDDGTQFLSQTIEPTDALGSWTERAKAHLRLAEGSLAAAERAITLDGGVHYRDGVQFAIAHAQIAKAWAEIEFLEPAGD
jgi:hypothetical protein